MLVSIAEGTLDRQEVYHWLENYHYLHRKSKISYAFGWKVNGELQAVMTIGKPASNALCEGICGKHNKDKVFEINRICAKESLEIPLSKFVATALKTLPNLILVSYSDRGQGHNGTIYQALNFHFTGSTKVRTDISTEGHSRHYEKASEYPNRKIRTSKNRYVLFVGEKRFKRSIAKELKYPILPYPKEVSQRYEIDWTK